MPPHSIPYRKIGQYENSLLDNGYGKCVLQQPEVRQQLLDVIRFYEGKKYNILAFVIMPNHVHLLIQPIEENTLEKIIASIKRNSAIAINKATDSTGKVWMKRYFDHLVRNEQSLIRYIEYIKRNPTHLTPKQYTLFVNDRLLSTLIKQ